MKRGLSALLAIVCSAVAVAQQVPESVYALPDLPSADAVDGAGQVHFGLGVSYFTDYVYRGVEFFQIPGREDNPNFQVDAKLSFDLGKLPHPYVSVFTNAADSDPVNSFEEIRPQAGFDWPIKPLVFSAGYTAYLYPDREELQTNEVFFRVAFDEKTLYHGEPIPTPYLLAAYDFDKYDGFYLEAGVKYRVPIDELGITLTGVASVAYVSGYRAYLGDTADIPGFFTTAATDGDRVDGFQHYQLGLIGQYSISKLFDIPSRFGDFSLRGYLFYTDGMSNDPAATSELWGGASINLEF
ncbi:MAG: hypothetical protein QM754_01770 [Tepidisphaeraceae bacterium]